MRKLDNFIRNLKNIDLIAKESMADAMDNNLERFEQMQRERISMGINTEGNELERSKPRKDGSTSGYSPQYRGRRRNDGLQAEFPDLKVTGKWQNSITAKRIGLNILNITATDDKTKYLADKPYEQYLFVLGFSPDQRIQVKEMMAEGISNGVKKRMIRV